MLGRLGRTNAHLDIMKAFMAHRDTHVNIKIAEASNYSGGHNVEITKVAKRDSELMRSIAFVTMIFLLETFVATFFSMVFFRNGVYDESSLHLVIDHHVWTYVVVTLPLTAPVGIWYVAWSRAGSWSKTIQRIRKAGKSLSEYTQSDSVS